MKKVLKHEFKKHEVDPKTESAIMDQMDKCKDVTGPDDCELAGNYAKCMNDGRDKSETNAN